MLAMMGMGVVDNLLVGHLGEHALATMTLATMWFFGGSVVVVMGALRALDPLVSQAHGAGDDAAIGDALAQGFWFGLLLMGPLMALQLLAGPGLRLLGQPPELIPDAAVYCRILMLGVPGMLGFSTLRQILQALGVVRPPMVTLIVANVLNLGLGYTLVYPLGLGAIGCAISTAVCQWFQLGLLAYLSKDELLPRLPRPMPNFSWARLRPILVLAGPLAVQMGMEVWAFSAAGIMIGWIGSAELAGHAVVMNLASLSFMLPLGISAAAATRVGNRVGAGEPWLGAAVAALCLGAGVMTLSAAAFSLLPEFIARLYTSDASVIAVVVSILPIAATFQLFDGIQVVSFGVLRGAGDVRVPSMANLIGYWVVGLPLGGALAFWFDLGVRGVWIGLAIALICVALLLLTRVRSMGREDRVKQRVGAAGGPGTEL